ncbi:MAG: DMT family transporter [Pseudomonadota bacterium]
MTQIALFALMLVAGVGVPLMAALNAGLARHVESTFAAVAILASVALAGSLVLLATTSERPAWDGLLTTPKAYLLGGLLFVFYIGAITFSAPRIGLGNSVLMVLLGQLVCAAIIDHFGLFGALETQISFQRLAGLALVAVGIVIAQRAKVGGF